MYYKYNTSEEKHKLGYVLAAAIPYFTPVCKALH